MTKTLNPIISLSSILALRMLGLFMMMPVFSLYLEKLPFATPTLIGLSMGIYGLTQALLQIPFGAMSDRIGRKKIIVLGLILFILGSIVSALSDNIYTMIIGRSLQGAGAIGSTVMALMADLTDESERTKAMAIAGITIGVSFGFAMMIGPVLNHFMQVNGIFWLAAFFGLIAILLLKKVPTPKTHPWHEETEPAFHSFPTILKHPELMRFNIGIFILHLILTANFVVLPFTLQNLAGLNGNQQWLLYLPILFLAFLLSLPCIRIAEKNACVKTFFLSSILILAFAEFLLWIFAKNLLISAVSVLLFFAAFSLLEAFLPSLISRIAPPHQKGTALGVYSSSQFLGIFIGGIFGGWAYGKLGLTEVYLCCVVLALIWLIIAVKMNNLGGHHGKRY